LNNFDTSTESIFFEVTAVLMVRGNDDDQNFFH